ncbi:MAG: DUF262 domain-containing HNH endonuclease family protein [Hyphomicrobiaceae bacterium]|jgi:hypothetical protein
MFPNLFTAPLRIIELFSDPFRYTVPPYQRRYSWTTKEAGQLLDDIFLAIGDGDELAEADYFLGAILLTDAGAQAEWRNGLPRTPRTLEIVDGQQRLITLTILIAVLRDLAQQDGLPWSAKLDGLINVTGNPVGATSRLQLRGCDNDVIGLCVAAAQGRRAEPDGDSLEPSAEAILEVRDHFLAELQGLSPAERWKLADYLLTRCHAVVIVANDIDHGHRMFSVLNDRGRPLARKDIIKAEVLSGLRPEIAETMLALWNATERRLGEEFDAFFSHLRVIEGKGRLPIIAGIRAVREQAGGSERFMTNLFLPASEAFEMICRGIHEGAPESAEITRRLRYLKWLGSSEWVPPTMKWLTRYRANPAEILRFLELMERFSFALRLLCIGAGKRAARFSGVMSAIDDGTLFDADLSPCKLTADEQRHITYNLRNLHERHPQTCKLVLLRLNDELAGAPQNLDPADWTVEHVLPQSPGRNGQWRQWFPDNDEREYLTQSLGNLVLVRRTQNDKASNQDFARKKAIYFKYAQGEMPALTREVQEAEVWTPVQVREREERFLRILAHIWQLDLSALLDRSGEVNSFTARRRRAVSSA